MYEPCTYRLHKPDNVNVNVNVKKLYPLTHAAGIPLAILDCTSMTVQYVSDSTIVQYKYLQWCQSCPVLEFPCSVLMQVVLYTVCCRIVPDY